MKIAVPVLALCTLPGWGQTRLDVGHLPVVGTVDRRFQSYNIEMLEVTGGRFWKPYSSLTTPPASQADLYEYRPPTDLSNTRLRRLAAALGPAYVRISGTWANATWFQTTDGVAPSAPPEGFNGILTRAQWKGVVDFAKAANAEIVTSFAISRGVRDSQGVWRSDQAKALLSYTKALGGRIAAAEFMNEPTFADRGSAPVGYNAVAYARDLAVFRPFLKETSPETLLLGPGSVMEGGLLPIAINAGMSTEALFQATGPAYDVFSYHLYAAMSKRCAGARPALGTTPEAALSRDWLARPDTVHRFYEQLRDRFQPGKAIWLTETADAGCGGNPWAPTFLDTFRYVDTHARLAQHGVQVIAHNTLSASDYGLLDEHSLKPRANYWAALLWARLMGTKVLKPEEAGVYGHCLKDVPGGVTLVVLNTDSKQSRSLDMPIPSGRFVLTSPTPEDGSIRLNGKVLELTADGAIPELKPVAEKAGQLTFPPASITFLSIPRAANQSCR